MYGKVKVGISLTLALVLLTSAAAFAYRSWDRARGQLPRSSSRKWTNWKERDVWPPWARTWTTPPPARRWLHALLGFAYPLPGSVDSTDPCDFLRPDKWRLTDTFAVGFSGSLERNPRSLGKPPREETIPIKGFMFDRPGFYVILARGKAAPGAPQSIPEPAEIQGF